jgi:NTP pyrophosphatase (non-canonical NTP hydrolase)
MSAVRVGIYSAIDAERKRQAEKWSGKHQWGEGDCSSLRVAPMVKMAVLTEEVGEVARAMLDTEETVEALRAELVQVAAVAVAWLESLTDAEPDLFESV